MKIRKRLDVVENDMYLDYLYAIKEGDNYAQKICKKLGKSSGNVVRQLPLLEKNGLVYSKKKEIKKFPFKYRYYYLTKSGEITLLIGLKIKQHLKEIENLKEIYNNGKKFVS